MCSSLISNSKLRNNYFVLRHGKSEANLAGIILSYPDYGVPKYGLTEEGKSETKLSVEEALKEGILNKDTVIVSSDFKRTSEAAEVARKVLNASPVILSKKLRERNFGNWEKTSTANYEKVWQDDARDSSHKKNNVESADQVLERTTSLIDDLEEKYQDKNILLVSHGDILQILQTAFEKVPASRHRKLTHLKTGEIRRLHLK